MVAIDDVSLHSEEATCQASLKMDLFKHVWTDPARKILKNKQTNKMKLPAKLGQLVTKFCHLGSSWRDTPVGMTDSKCFKFLFGCGCILILIYFVA